MRRVPFRSSNRPYRIWRNRAVYCRLIARSLGRVALVDLCRTQFPFLLPDARTPPAVSVELTNCCPLRCTYCTSPAVPRRRGFMDDTTFRVLLSQLEDARVRRISLVGNGEPTLHPAMAAYARALASTGAVLSLTTNGLLLTDPLCQLLLETLDKVTISVDGCTKSEYEASRVGGDFDTLVRNLETLWRIKHEARSRTIIDIRVMIRPTQWKTQSDILRYWHRFADCTTPMLVLAFTGRDPDAFACTTPADVVPRCTLPSKTLGVRWNGDVPLCAYSNIQTGEVDGVLLGNIHTSTLIELWNSPTMKQYRGGHRRRDRASTPICAGCPGT